MPITRKLIEEYLEANDSPYAPLEMPDGMKGVFSKSLGSSSFEPISRSWADVFEEILLRDGTPGAKRYLASLQASRTRYRKGQKANKPTYTEVTLARSNARIKRKEEGMRLRELRTLHQMTQKELSLLTGIKQPSICEMEKGRYAIPEIVWDVFK